MVTAARTAGVPAVVGNEFRWAPDRAAIGRAIAEGAIGEPRLATLVSSVSLVADPQTRMPAWWFDPAAGGGWLLASGSHVVDQVRSWLGEFESVSAALPHVSDRESASAEDSFLIRFRLKSGVDGVLLQSGGAWGPTVGLTVVAGSAASIGIDESGPWIADRAGRRPLPIADDLVLPPVAESAAPAERFSHLELGPYTRLCEALFAMVEGRDPQSAVPVPTFADGLAHMRVLDAVRASAADNGRVVAV